MSTIIGCVVVGVIVLAAVAIYLLERLYPLDEESAQDWIDRQW